MQEPASLRVSAMASEPYVEVFGRFWEGMSFLIASSKALSDLLGESVGPGSFTTRTLDALGAYLESEAATPAQWPHVLTHWQSYAFTAIEAHGLLDEYLRATFELLLLAHLTEERITAEGWWEPHADEIGRDLEREVAKQTDRFEKLEMWKRVARLRKGLGLEVRLDHELERALVHQRRIRNAIVHGQLTPHVLMPEDTIMRVREYAPPPYVPLGPHVIRGVFSVCLAVHMAVDTAVARHLSLPADPGTSMLMAAQVDEGRGEWFADPWEPHPEHLFSPDVLRSWAPG